MKFTKGEWTVEDGTQVVCGNRLVANTGGYTTNYSLERETNEANAQLIAAAPELYEALKHYVELDKDGIFKDMYLLATTALAKAEGKSC